MCNVKSFEQCDGHLDVEFYGGRVYISSCTRDSFNTPACLHSPCLI